MSPSKAELSRHFSNGSVILELAIILPLMLLIAGNLADYGVALYEESFMKDLAWVTARAAQVQNEGAPETVTGIALCTAQTYLGPARLETYQVTVAPYTVSVPPSGASAGTSHAAIRVTVTRSGTGRGVFFGRSLFSSTAMFTGLLQPSVSVASGMMTAADQCT